MYIDGERSWLMHAGEHFNRKNGGVRPGDKVGLLLTFPEKTLTLYVNEELKVFIFFIFVFIVAQYCKNFTNQMNF